MGGIGRICCLLHLLRSGGWPEMAWMRPAFGGFPLCAA
ncbi:unnamed protein product [Arabidopsis lyrata]|nr:unnamed protein product [Arabidopsis lyrata]